MRNDLIMHEILVIRSSISSSLLKKTLLRGGAIAFLGVIILLIGGVSLSLNFLNHWGWLLFIISLALITRGMLPYRHLSRLESNPDKLIFYESNCIAYCKMEKIICAIPIQFIEKINYFSDSEHYGIAFWLKRSSDEMNPNIIDSKYPIEMKKIKKQRKEYGDADLFIPYFNERGYRELVAWLYTAQ